MVYKETNKIVEFTGSVSKMGDNRMIYVPKCIADNLEEYRGKKIKVTVSTV